MKMKAERSFDKFNSRFKKQMVKAGIQDSMN